MLNADVYSLMFTVCVKRAVDMDLSRLRYDPECEGYHHLCTGLGTVGHRAAGGSRPG